MLITAGEDDAISVQFNLQLLKAKQSKLVSSALKRISHLFKRPNWTDQSLVQATALIKFRTVVMLNNNRWPRMK